MDTQLNLGFGHVGLTVTDIERSIRFYIDVLQLELIGRSEPDQPKSAFLGLEESKLLTLWEQSDKAADTDTSGMHHLAFSVDSLAEVKALEARLHDHDISITYDGIVAHAEGASSGGLFFNDPDGIHLEVTAPTGLAGFPAPSGALPTCGHYA